MKPINQIISKATEQVGTEFATPTFLPELTQAQQLKANVFCNDLAGALGARFTRELPTEEMEQQFKRVNGRLIDSFTEDDIRSGFAKISTLRARNELTIYELADVFPIFDKYQLSTGVKAKLYREYLEGGIEITENAKHPMGHIVKKTIGRKWSSGVMRAISGILGDPKYHEETHGKNAKAEFNKQMNNVLIRLKAGEKFELPEAIADNSSSAKPNNDGKSGHADFMKQFKRG